MMDTNSIVATTQQAVQMAPVLTKWQQHWPVVTVTGMWLIREAHVWWPFVTNNGGIIGVVKILFKGNAQPQPPTAPKQ